MAGALYGERVTQPSQVADGPTPPDADGDWRRLPAAFRLACACCQWPPSPDRDAAVRAAAVGVDWEALQKAYEKNNRKGKVVAGGSTITQQLAKNLFLSGQRSYLRKAQEFVITYMLEFWMEKERIFEIYLNVVEWGNGVYGAEAASEHYYGISAAALNPSQAAKLAVMLPDPRRFDKNRTSAYLERRTELILHRMGSADLP